MARAPRRADLKREIASIDRDPRRMLFGNRVEPEDQTLATRGQGKGLALYEGLKRDWQVRSEFQKRKLALIGRPWEVEPADETPAAKRAAEYVSEHLKALKVERLVSCLLEAILKGVAIVEIIWAGRPDGVVPIAAKSRNPQRFTFHHEANADGVVEYPLRLLTREQPLDGEPVPPMKFVVHREGDNYDNPWGEALGQALFWPVFFKRQGVSFWLSGLEKFGQPTSIGRYPAGTPEAEQKKLLAALQAIATDAGVIVPEGMVIELLEAKRAGTFDSYHSLATYMDGAISKLILGQTLTSAVGESGSRALGDVHNEVRKEITKGDADLLSATLNATLVPWIVELNLPSAPPPRLWWDVSEPEDLTATAQRDKTLREIGFRPTLDRITEVYGEGYEPVSEPPPEPPAPDPGRGLAAMFREIGQGRPLKGLRRLSARLQPGSPPTRLEPFQTAFKLGVSDRGFAEGDDRGGKDAADALTDQLAALLAEGEDPLVTALTALVERAASLQEVADGLVALLPEISDARLTELMAQALIVANLQGRSDLADGV